MTVKTMQTNDVKELLEKVAGFDQAGGNERMKKIVHRVMHDISRSWKILTSRLKSSGALFTTWANWARTVKLPCWPRAWEWTATWTSARTPKTSRLA